MPNASLVRFAQAAHSYLRDRMAIGLRQILDQGGKGLEPSLWKQLRQLHSQIGETELVERASYIWFNRLCAWRYMDLHHVTEVGLVSAVAGLGQPEIMGDVKAGIFDCRLLDESAIESVTKMLDEPKKYGNAHWKIYRLVLDGAAQYWRAKLPFLFREQDDWANILLPEDIISVDGLLTQMNQAMQLPDCQNVEVIGWLYQYYLAERKARVYAKFQQNCKVDSGEISAATGLYTPEWIVRYLLDNTLGRLWLASHPDSPLRKRLQYYIEPQGQIAPAAEVISPEDILICDPACGSGHMLVYAFELLWDIYQECGYCRSEIAETILRKNLWGLEIDERAGQLAGFALCMKAREHDFDFFRNNPQPNICVLQDSELTKQQIDEYLAALNQLAPGLIPDLVLPLLGEFTEAKQFGSLIRPSAEVSGQWLEAVTSWVVPPNWEHQDTHQKIIQSLRQAHYLSQKYHVVVTNPPYLNSHHLGASMIKWLGKHYRDGKTDLFAAFVIRGLELARPQGFLGFMTPMVWMFISSYSAMRQKLTRQATIASLIQLEYSGFPDATVPICAFTICNAYYSELSGAYIRLTEFRGPAMQAPKTLEAISNPHCGWFYRAKSAEFGQITGSPIAYWVTAGERQVFADNPPISQAAVAKEGLSTADNARFLRLWYEVSWDRIGLAMSSRSQAQASGKKWFPCNKGGQFRKWYGNHEYVINWQNDGSQLRSFCDDRGKSRSVIRNPHHYFQPSLSWGMITSAANAFRYYPAGWINDHAAGCAFPITEQAAMPLLCYLNSHFVNRLTKTINPTINFPPGTFNKLPMPRAFLDKLEASVGERLVAIAKEDWDSQETSWEFVTSPFLQPQFREESLETSYRKIRAHWQALTKEMQQLETQCNQLFLETYALEGAISAEVSLGEITLINNPYYRYGGERTEAQLEELALADSARDLVSYAVGCMFGRYALEKPGLILASQGQTLSDYNHFVYGSQALPDRVFAPVKDNIVPVLSERWFANDAASRLVEFVELAFGKTNLRRNLAFLEGALGKELDSYLLKDFYSDHQRRYRKRPIYWMFASPKGAFKVLVYMHRYDANTLRLVLADYIEDYMAKAHNEQNQIELMLRQDNNDSLAVRRWQKRSAMLSRIATETSLYHRVLYDLVYSSDPEVDISSLDLDEGVKRNYARFKPAIVAI